MASSDGPDDWIELPPLANKAMAAADGPDDWQELPPKVPEKGTAETMMRGVAQGATLGFADEATAGLGALKDYTAGKLHLRGDIGLKDAYNSYIDKIRAEDAKAKSDNPWTYGLSELGGAVGSTAVGPGTALAPVKGASMLGNAGRIAAGGAVMGGGLTEAPPTSPQFYKDAAFGAGTSLATAGLIKGAGAMVKAATPTNLARKASNVLLNTPEEITDLYIKDPERVRSAPTRLEVVQRYKDLLDKLKTETVEGSAKSRDILRGEGSSVKGSEVADILNAKAEEIAKRAEGVMGDDPQKMAAYRWLKDTARNFEPEVIESPQTGSGLVDANGMPFAKQQPPQVIDKELSTNRIKDILQGLDRQTEWDVGSGKFGRIDDGVKKEVRAQIDEMLKGRSTAYRDQMKSVSADAALLGDAAPLANNEGAMANVLRRLQTDQYGGGQVPKDTLEAFDKRMGSDILGQAKYAHAREAFDKSVTNGSRNVNLFSNMMKDVPVLKHLGPLVGGTVDKYGRQMTMSAVDAAAALNKTWQRDGIQKFMADIEPIVAAARKGDASAALTMQLLEKTNPKAARAVSGDAP